MRGTFPIVALVCSAGGLEALTRVLAPLPAKMSAAVIVLQHMSPERHSHLAAVLDQRTALPVVPAGDGAPLRPGQVLVAPSGQHTIATRDETLVQVSSAELPPYRPSADLLLTSLAVVAAERVIAVVLTGRGNDAATGASMVHRLGGTVIACSPRSATQPSMPQAAIDRGETVDHVVDLDHLGSALIALTTAAAIGGARPLLP